MLEKYLVSGKNYVMSYDKDGRATHIFVPRKTLHHHPQYSIQESIYTMERAIACSRAPDRSVNAIVDCRGFVPWRHSPPLAVGTNFMTTFRHHYAGQVHKIFILDAPASFIWLWNNIFKPFLGPSTQAKIVFVTGNQQKQTILGSYYDRNQVAEWMMPPTTTTNNSSANQNNTGKNREFDPQEYLYETPFDQAFDE